MSGEKVIITMHMGGNFVKNPNLQYVGGDEVEWAIDRDLLSYLELIDLVRKARYRNVMWFSYLVPGDSLKDEPIVCFDDASFRTMIANRKKGNFHVYVEHQVDIAHYADENKVSEDIDVMFESNDGGTCEDKGGGPNSCIGLGFNFAQRKGYGSEDDEIRTIGQTTEKKDKQKRDRDDGSGDEIDYIHSSDVGSYDSEEDAEMFKGALVNYDDPRGFDYKLVRNESDKVSAKCKDEGCPWVIYASIDSSDGFFKVKKLISHHECFVTFKNSKANYKFIGKHFLGKLRIIAKLTLQEMQRLAREELNVVVPINLCCKARLLAKEEINGRVKYEFDRLVDYAEALRQADPNCNVDLMVVRPTVGRDTKDQIYPIAWVVVEGETKETWRWFLENLKTDLHLGDGAGFTIMSDMQRVRALN
ncbi:hypothetical protein GQ457_17G011300 [Hibiscus cannabinus]